jgi:hypothetical protein
MHPEIRRGIWSGLQPLSALGVLAAQALALAAAGALGGEEGLAKAAFWAAAVLGLGLGARRAATMVLGEIAERTWDATRAAALSPLSMALGKFVGAVLPSWILLLPALTCLAWLDGGAEAPLLAMRILCGQAIAAAAGLAFARLLDGQAAVGTGGAQLAGIAAVAWLPRTADTARWPDLSWWGWSLSPEALLAAVLGLGNLLALVATWRLCADLQRLPVPFGAWAAGLTATGAFLAGIDAPLPILQAVLGPPAERLWLAIGSVAIGGAYLGMLLEVAPTRPWRRLRHDWYAGRRRQALARIPAATTAIALSALAFALGVLDGTVRPLAAAAALLLALRDAGIVWTLAAGRPAPHGVAIGATALGVLHGAAPALLVALDMPSALPFAGAWGLAEGGPDGPTALAAGAQALVALALWRWRIRRLGGS